MSTYVWDRGNEKVRFKGFSRDELAQMAPALAQTDRYLSPTRTLNAQFKKGNPNFPKLNTPKIAAETRYSRLLPNSRATVVINPEIFQKNRYQWNPSGVVSHEVGHLLGPTRNTTFGERQAFKKAFGYKQKAMVHELAPEMWRQRRNNPVRNIKTRQAQSASEDFAETWRFLTGEPFTNRTNSDYFSVVTTPRRVDYMQRYMLK